MTDDAVRQVLFQLFLSDLNKYDLRRLGQYFGELRKKREKGSESES